MNGKLITLNGIGRSGKTTQATLLKEAGMARSVHTYNVRDYFIHDVIGVGNDEPMYGIASLPWMLLQLQQNIIPHLLLGETVVVDHYFADIHADFSLDWHILDEFLQNTGFPSLHNGHHIYLDIGSKVFHARAKNRDHTERHQIPIDVFYEKREKYRKLASQGYLTQIDGNQSPEKVHQQIKEIICEPASN